ncbi:pyridoxal phosphate-dependent transferase [Lineolata rhizophorae]|uniref:Pyridoxal phosphate-dependent transferase n=1 Tax=Lineolata rhizophorae TaxID=578093 RepID=A0A6A6P860_9PEZI|nr:pyridoxal phosphate-dependent transferase [Lineolata rhizophorae]
MYTNANASKEAGAKGYANDGRTINHWAAPGPAEFDFRSDVMTVPTMSMLEAIKRCTLRDDVFSEDPTTLSLESFLAELTGHDAALLVLSGTMGNQVALRAHLQGPPHSVLCDHRAHILKYEAGGTASLCGALVSAVVPSNGVHLTLEDVKKHAVLSDDIHACPTKVIELENTLGGAVMPLAECQRISAWARENGILMHLDGARLWEAVAAGHGALKDYSACFDSISLCFSKGLGAPIGSIVVGSDAFIKRARWIRKSIGGGLRQAGVVAAPARIAVEETFLGGRLTESHERAREIAELWQSSGGKLSLPTVTNMVWFDLESAGISEEEFIKIAAKKGLRTLGSRLVVHYQISDDAIARLREVIEQVLPAGSVNGKNGVKRKRDAEDETATKKVNVGVKA